jgi:hypothetical protein
MNFFCEFPLADARFLYLHLFKIIYLVLLHRAIIVVTMTKSVLLNLNKFDTTV